MPVVICLPLKPRSLNAKPKLSYITQISSAAAAKTSLFLPAGPLYSKIIWFHKYATVQGDIDNIAKRIHDALKGVVFADDQVITHTMAIKVDVRNTVEIIKDEQNTDAFIELFERLAEPDMRDVLYVEVGTQHSHKIHLGPAA